MLNQITIMGRVTKDLELTTSKSGKSYVKFSLAVDRDQKKEDGSRDTDFISCTAFGKTAEFTSKYFGKGRMMVASGRLQMDKFTDKDGNNRTSANVIVQNAYFADSKKDGADNVVPPAPAPVANYAVIDDDDAQLPF